MLGQSSLGPAVREWGGWGWLRSWFSAGFEAVLLATWLSLLLQLCGVRRDDRLGCRPLIGPSRGGWSCWVWRWAAWERKLLFHPQSDNKTSAEAAGVHFGSEKRERTGRLQDRLQKHLGKEVERDTYPPHDIDF